MEEIAILNPISMVTNDEMSDDSISLDLHVSDTDESEECSTKKFDADERVFSGKLLTETEDDILNKYVADSPPVDLDKSAEDVLLPDEDPVLSTNSLPNQSQNGPTSSENSVNGSHCNDVMTSAFNGQKATSTRSRKAGAVFNSFKNNATLSGTDNALDGDAKVSSGKRASREGKKQSVENTKCNGFDTHTNDEINGEDDKSDKNKPNIEKTPVVGCHDGGRFSDDDDEDMVCNGFESEEESAKTFLDADVVNCIDKFRKYKRYSSSQKNKSKKRSNVEREAEGNTIEMPDEEGVAKTRANLCNGEIKDMEDLNSESADKDTKIESSKEISKPRTSDKHKTDDTEDSEDLLQVMDERTVDEAEQETKDEHSCSSSEKDEESRDNHEETSRDNQEDGSPDNLEEELKDSNGDVANDESKDIMEEVPQENVDDNNDSQVDMDIEAGECPMDIEESDIGAIFVDDNARKATTPTMAASDKVVLRREDSVNIDIEESVLNELDNDANKENINTTTNKEKQKDKASVVSSDKDTATEILTNGICDHLEAEGDKDESVVADSTKKCNKRHLSDPGDDEGAKKIRLEEVDGVGKEDQPEKHHITLLNCFKEFMLDKTLQTVTRAELEQLLLQKVCECIFYKSELGELRQKVKVQEQAIDTWRKEAVVVAKQTRDLKIVHERLTADLKAAKEQLGKPLVPVKITRSVGLQAIIENGGRQRPVMNGATTPQRTTPVSTLTKTATPVRQPMKKIIPQRQMNKPPQTVGQKDNGNNLKSRQVPSVQANKTIEPKAVIDLTDEDEKNQTTNATAATATASPTVRIVNKSPNNTVNNNINTTSAKVSANIVTSSSSPKIMIMSPSVLTRAGGTVMLKVNSNNVVTQANGILPSVPNGQVSVLAAQPVVRTVQQVRVPVASVRATTPSKPVYKHPAPLPAPPAIQQSIVAKKPIPPRPHLNLNRSSCGTGIVLQWKMPYKLDMYESVVSYQLYAYQETKSPPRTDNWGKIGDVKALDLPMAVTLTQFAVGNRYYFAVRAVDSQKRLGPFSEPQTILL